MTTDMSVFVATGDARHISTLLVASPHVNEYVEQSWKAVRPVLVAVWAVTTDMSVFVALWLPVTLDISQQSSQLRRITVSK